MRRAAQVDRNQTAIAEALRKVGATVQFLHVVGRGCPDLLVGFRGRNYLLEVKDRTQYKKWGRDQRINDGLTEAEARWHAIWCGEVEVVASVDEAMSAIGVQFIEDPEEHASRQLLNDRGVPGSVDDETVMARAR